MGVDDGDVRVNQLEVKTALIANGEEAIEAGGFGIPTIVIAGELFLGDDAFEMFADYVVDPAMMRSDEMVRAAHLVPSSH